MNLTRLAYLNVTRRFGKSLVSGVIVSITIAIFTLVFSLYSTVESGIKLSADRMGADIVILPNEANVNEIETMFTGVPMLEYMDKDVIKGKIPMEDVESITEQFFIKTLANTGCCGYEKEQRIVGINQNTDFILKPWFNDFNVERLSKNQILIGGRVERALESKVMIFNKEYSIVGDIYRTGSSIDESIFMDIEEARDLATRMNPDNIFDGRDTDQLVSSILIKTKDGVDPRNMMRKIKSNEIDAQVISTADNISKLSNQIKTVSKILGGFSLALIFTSSLALAARFNSMASERKKEIGYLHAVGLKKSKIVRLILTEALMIAAVGGIVGALGGVALTSPLYNTVSEIMVLPSGEWDMMIAVKNAAVGIGLSLIIGIASAIYPALMSSRLEPQEAISKGDM
ncbi:macrolide export ATP-binding/permease protein MacB [Andreesenia angusta]|uniref:Macrolide export ATP-binding/permease protein MacB n=1 Tax=Andreesenia angusta TaxID=39480 RepID=A0A1S1V6I0_9FIRM|nr:ABC transporter permease [Andreesenia angusta]OHW61990.1 macrolide export ATP-binding/permease protein MacB [Andreesenia angusta]